MFLLPNEQILICELTQPYVAIEDFQEIFQAAVPLVRQYGIRKFIFDKQHLRIFHQPSMEWYFVHWKKELYELGLSSHRKILPAGQPFFASAVEAGKAKIMAEYKDNIIHLLDIQYKDTIEAAIRS